MPCRHATPSSRQLANRRTPRDVICIKKRTASLAKARAFVAAPIGFESQIAAFRRSSAESRKCVIIASQVPATCTADASNRANFKLRRNNPDANRSKCANCCLFALASQFNSCKSSSAKMNCASIETSLQVFAEDAISWHLA